MTTLVIGFGSIGKRHSRVLRELGEEVLLLTSQLTNDYTIVQSLEEALSNHLVDRVVIANKTSDHIPTLNKLGDLNYKGVVLVEKPLGSSLEDLKDEYTFKVLVAYNLRFHPITIFLKEMISSEKILFVHSYVGQYLPSWRPGRDYRKSYSALKAEGGGVLRDLSHEMDLLQYILGPISLKSSFQSKLSSLEIETDDYTNLTGVNNDNVHWTTTMNYLDKNSARFIRVVTNENSIACNFISGEIETNGERKVLELDSDSSYRNMHKALLKNENLEFCSLEEGRNILRMFEEVEDHCE